MKPLVRLLMTLGVLLALTAGMTLTVIAQDLNPPAEPIEPGIQIEGMLDAEAPRATYAFEGSSGDMVTITLTSSEFDAYLALLASDGTVVAQNDDGAGRLNALITFTLPTDDTYTIIATSLRAYRSDNRFTATGSYMLTFELMDGDAAQNETVEDPDTTDEAAIEPEEIPLQTEPEPMPIAYGVAAEGSIDAGETAPFNFEAEEGDQVTITLESSDFDAYLFLRNAEGEILARDDDGGTDSNARINGFVIPATGVYTIIVDSFGNTIGINPGGGDFTLMLEQGIGGVIDEDDDSTNGDMRGEISYGDVVESRLTNAMISERVTFTGAAGDIITITMTSEDFDTYLLLLDPSGTEITRDDDSAGALNSRIGPFVLSEDGTYTIVANSYDGIFGGSPQFGSYLLRLDTAEITSIEYGETVEGELSSETIFAVYGFEGEAGTVVTTSLDTESFSVYMNLNGAGGAIDQQTFGGPDLLGPIVLPEDGRYLVTVSSYETFQPQAFTLTINTVTPQAILYDVPFSSEIPRGEAGIGARVYTFDGSEGDIINVLIQSEGPTDTRLTVTGPAGMVIGTDDDSGEGYDPELLGLVLYEDGTYAVLVEPYIPGDGGAFSVLVENAGVLALDATPQIVRVSDKQASSGLTFEGSAGETVRISARVLVNTQAQPLITVIQDGETLASNPIGDVERLILEFTVPADGRVQVIVEDLNFIGAVLEIALERVEPAP
ncbi:MAG: PPC domain-containing protein [Chloroflexota bacterium]